MFTKQQRRKNHWLTALRQSKQIYGRTLLGMLLFVWLSMAIAPCVMANDLANIVTEDISALHSNMEDCVYCPDDQNRIDNSVICDNTHNNFSDSITLSIDTIDSADIVLIELPDIPLLLVSKRQRLSFIQKKPVLYYLSPLSLTGILRI